MDLNDRLQAWRAAPSILPREEALARTIQTSQDLYFRLEEDRLLNHWEFLWTQLRYTRKRWWAMQAALLLLAWQVLPAIEHPGYRIRSMGVIACLFVVLIIPELWRNRENQSIQVEAACLYSLRQVYSARITLFGLVDIGLLTLFSLGLGGLGYSWMEVLAQLLLPVTVTACICFSLLCGGCQVSESVCLTACLACACIWWLILMDETLYARILPPVWIALFAMALGLLVLTVRRALRTTNQIWEVAFV